MALGIVDPKHGEQWFKLITTKTLEEKGFSMGLEKLNVLCLAEVSNETRCQWLSLCLGGAVARDQYSIPQGDKLFRMWVAREAFYEALRLEASNILELCQDARGSVESFASSFPKYFTSIKFRNGEQLFHALTSIMEPIISTEAKLAAKRVTWRYFFQLKARHEIEEMPIITDMWNQVSITREVSMYSAKANISRKAGLSEWEVKYCPWWIDFKEGEYPPSEAAQYHLHEKGCLVVEDKGDVGHSYGNEVYPYIYPREASTGSEEEGQKKS